MEQITLVDGTGTQHFGFPIRVLKSFCGWAELAEQRISQLLALVLGRQDPGLDMCKAPCALGLGLEFPDQVPMGSNFEALSPKSKKICQYT